MISMRKIASDIAFHPQCEQSQVPRISPSPSDIWSVEPRGGKSKTIDVKNQGKHLSTIVTTKRHQSGKNLDELTPNQKKGKGGRCTSHLS